MIINKDLQDKNTDIAGAVEDSIREKFNSIKIVRVNLGRNPEGKPELSITLSDNKGREKVQEGAIVDHAISKFQELASNPDSKPGIRITDTSTYQRK